MQHPAIVVDSMNGKNWCPHTVSSPEPNNLNRRIDPAHITPPKNGPRALTPDANVCPKPLTSPSDSFGATRLTKTKQLVKAFDPAMDLSPMPSQKTTSVFKKLTELKGNKRVTGIVWIKPIIHVLMVPNFLDIQGYPISIQITSTTPLKDSGPLSFDVLYASPPSSTLADANMGTSSSKVM